MLHAIRMVLAEEVFKRLQVDFNPGDLKLKHIRKEIAPCKEICQILEYTIGITQIQEQDRCGICHPLDIADVRAKVLREGRGWAKGKSARINNKRWSKLFVQNKLYIKLFQDYLESQIRLRSFVKDRKQRICSVQVFTCKRRKAANCFSSFKIPIYAYLWDLMLWRKLLLLPSAIPDSCRSPSLSGAYCLLTEETNEQIKENSRNMRVDY